MTPLSEKLRPQMLSEVFGQNNLVALLQQIIQNKKPLSLLLYGPPGCGKTTLARIYARSFDLPFLNQSAVFHSAADLKRILKEGEKSPLFHRQKLLFVDEIHRFNRSQQDVFLPFLEDGSLILIGATTENPSFVLNNALLSRLRVLKLDPLPATALAQMIDRYEVNVRPLNLSKEEKETLISHSQGDGRHLLNMIENLEEGLPSSQKLPIYDRNQESHFNLISALHKSIRGSDPDAALYWLCRMLHGGEDPLYLARRLVRIASEDIGLADPNALTYTLNACDAYKMLGSPEGELALAQATIYLALAPKSNAIYSAYGAAQEMAAKTSHLDPPKHILNAPTPFMKKMGYGEEYVYDPDTPHGFSGQNYFPKERHYFYKPFERGFEREMKKRLEYFARLREHLSFRDPEK